MDRSHLVLDIETIIDPELPISESSAVERLPAPPHHQIVAIGVLWFDRNYSVLRIGVIGEGKGEAEALADFTRFADERQPHLVTYNGRSFDLPVLASRCLRHGIPFRYYYQGRDVRYRFSPEGHLDLMDYIADFGAARTARLDVIAKLCGMPGKVGVDGKDVGPMVHAGQLDLVRNYCLCDVVQTAGVFLRVQLLRGELTPALYKEAMQGLLNAARADARVAPVVASWNEPRLLLQPGEAAPPAVTAPLVTPAALAQPALVHAALVQPSDARPALAAAPPALTPAAAPAPGDAQAQPGDG